MTSIAILNTSDIRHELRDNGFKCLNFHSGRCSHLILHLNSNTYSFSSRVLGIPKISSNPINIPKVVLLNSLGLSPEEIRETIES